MVKTNQYITGGCLKNDDGVLTVRDESKKWLGNIVTRSCWTHSLQGIRKVHGGHCWIDRKMVLESGSLSWTMERLQGQQDYC